MLDQILASRTWLASWLAGMALLNYSVTLLILGQRRRQPFIDAVDWRPAGVVGRIRSDAGQHAIPLLAVAVAAAVTLFVDRLVRETIIGGLLVLQMASLASNVADLLAVRALCAPDAAEGRLRYSAPYRYRAAGGRMIGLALLTVLVGMLFSSAPFLVGSVLLLATAGGWYRRARQAARQNGEAAK